MQVLDQRAPPAPLLNGQRRMIIAMPPLGLSQAIHSELSIMIWRAHLPTPNSMTWGFSMYCSSNVLTVRWENNTPFDSLFESDEA